MAAPGRIRPITICVIRRNERILVFEGRDGITGQTYYRPLGGGIEPGEYSRQAIVREMREEIGAALTDVRYLGVLENIFTHEGRAHHEIVLVYEADFVDQALYVPERLEGREDDGSILVVLWKPLASFRAGEATLYPDGLLELLN